MPGSPQVRRRSAVSFAALVWLLLTTTTAPAGTQGPVLRDVGVEAGLDPTTFSYGVDVRDFDDDGWPDLLLAHHGGAARVMRNTGEGFIRFARLVDTLHERNDRHGCAWDDVDLDGNDDIYCTKGAHLGTSEKWNELWIHRPFRTFTDRAATYGVEDRWGRGRLAAFLDINGDAYPDLFVGNQFPRADGRRSPNRTFVNVDGTRFEEVRLGLTRETGAECVHVADVNGDGRDDLLLCGRDGFQVYLRQHGFVERTEDLGVSARDASAAFAAKLSGGDAVDLVVVRRGSVSIQRGRGDGTFETPVETWGLRAGTGVAVGDVDGVHGLDVYVVQGCVDGVNLPDALLVNRGDGAGWDRVEVNAGPVAGCGDAAASIDFDRDGLDDIVVQNGKPLVGGKGPDQLLTAGDWTA